jgi:predicted nucleic acid-binding protein
VAKLNKPIIFDTNIYLSAFLQCTEISKSIITHGVINFGVVISPIQYREIISVFHRLAFSPKNAGKYSYDDAFLLLEEFVKLEQVEVCSPLNIFHLKHDLADTKYQSLAKTDPKDLFLLDLALFVNASYLVTRDLRLIESMGGAKNIPVMYHSTMVVNQGFFARLVMNT